MIEPRNRALDIARALAVLGVVVNHTWAMLEVHGIMAPGSAVGSANYELVVPRMSVLFFFIGVFIPSGVAKLGTAGYIRRRVTLLLWVYVVWFVLQGIAEMIGGHRTDPLSLLRLWEPYYHLWFLPALALTTTVVVLLRVWERWWALALCLVVGTLLWSWSLPVVGIDGFPYLVFLAAGAAVGRTRVLTALSRHRLQTLAGGAVGVVVYLLLYQLGLVPARGVAAVDLFTRVASVAAGFAAIPIVAAAALLLAWVPGVRDALTYIGRKTLPIYAAHAAPVSLAMATLLRLGIPPANEAVFWLACLAAGIAFPLLLDLIAPRIGMRWLFDTPRFLQPRSARRPARVASQADDGGGIRPAR